MGTTTTIIVADAANGRRWMRCPYGGRWLVASLLLLQTGLLGYSATRHSPTHLEPAFLASGISHWRLGRFELYRVNPPLVRMVAAIPVLAVGCNTEWGAFDASIHSRSEFKVGADFIRVNGERSLALMIYARWACIPFSLLGSYCAYRWAQELYGGGAGLLALSVYVLEPNLLAHGELITPDAACSAFGIFAGYSFWRWLQSPTWSRALLAGTALGFAELTKMTWVILFGLWPFMWAMAYLAGPAAHLLLSRHYKRLALCGARRSLGELPQLIVLLGVGLYVLNLGYGFDGTFTPAGDFTFISNSLSANDRANATGNRFADSWIGLVPLPLPRQYVIGLDVQKHDFEDYGQFSYLGGNWQDGGWWYYYVYGLAVKTSHGTHFLLLLAALLLMLRLAAPLAYPDWPSAQRTPWGGVCFQVALAGAVMVLVSSQLEFNHHVRYVLPVIGLASVLIGYVASNRHFPTRSGLALVAMGLAFHAAECLSVYPHHLAYFNAMAGGPENGHRHLLHSNLDWGQDLLLVREWMRERSILPDNVSVASYNPYPPVECISLRPGLHSNAQWEIVSATCVFDPRYQYADRLEGAGVVRISYTTWAFPIALPPLLQRFYRSLTLTESKSVPVRVALLAEPTIDPAETAELIDVLNSDGSFECRIVTSEDIRAGGLKDHDALLVPGGNAAQQAHALGVVGQDAIRTFIHEGGGYIGICAGAFLATNKHIGVVPTALLNGDAVRGPFVTPHVDATGAVNITLSRPFAALLSMTREVAGGYSGGPLFSSFPNNGLSDAHIASYSSLVVRNGDAEPSAAAAIVAAAYGSGRVICIGPHIEQSLAGAMLLRRLIKSTVSDHGDQGAQSADDATHGVLQLKD